MLVASVVIPQDASASESFVGAPPAIGPGGGNVPTIVDATPAYNAVLKTAPVNAPETPLVPLVAIAGLVIAGLAWQRPRRRRVSSPSAG